MKQKISIGMAVGNYVDPHFMVSLARLCNYKSKLYDIVSVYFEKGAYVTVNKTKLVEKFINDANSDWLMIFDIDLSFDDKILDRLLGLSVETKSKVVSGWYNTFIGSKVIPLSFVRGHGGFVPRLPVGDKPFKVDGVGSGCLMVHRDVYLKIPRDKFGMVFYFGDILDEFPEAKDHKLLGEDLTFSINCSKVEQQIYTRSDLRAKHHRVCEV